MSSFSPQFVKSLVKKLFPTLRKTQQSNLALAVFGQVTSQSTKISEIARVAPGARKHKHRVKRFWRFLSNPRVKPEQLREYWVGWCIKTFNKNHIVKVAIDWTTLPGNIQCLMIAIPFHGRAIPLVWQLVFYTDIKDSQNRIEERVIARLITLVHESFPEKKLLITADRGFGRSTFIQFLQNKQVLFVVRVKGDVTVTTSAGKRINLRKLGKTLTMDIPQWYEQISYRGDRKVTGVNLAAVVATLKKQGTDPDPWFLITNLRKPETTIARYYERFHIEELFKDLKHQLGITALQTKNLMRVRRMMFISVTSYGITMLLGSVANKLTTVKDTLITNAKKTASRIWFAIQIIKHNLLGRAFWSKVYQVATGP